MKHRMLTLGTAFVLGLSLLAGCGSQTSATTAEATTTEAPETTTADTTEAVTESAVTDEATAAEETEAGSIRIGSMKGPTSMGLVSLMNQEDTGYDFTMVTAADELLTMMIGGDLDIAMVPANVASVLYNRTEGGISVININTLGVLYIVESGETLSSIEDLKGRTLYLTGKGTTPDYVIQYLLTANGLTTEDVTLEYKSEATEVVSVLSEDPEAIGLLPQPFVTVAEAQNENLRTALDLTQEWTKVQGSEGSQLVTGVTIVNNDFFAENPEVIAAFLADYKTSTEFTNSNVEAASVMIADLGIVAQAPIAAKAIPYCNITYIDGAEMQTALEGYLTVLFEQNPQAVGGSMPAEDFYYIP